MALEMFWPMEPNVTDRTPLLVILIRRLNFSRHGPILGRVIWFRLHSEFHLRLIECSDFFQMI